MTFRSRTRLASMLFALACASRLAHADPTPAEISTARQAFESAVALEGDQKWQQATLKLHQALAIKDTPGLRFHLAHCEEEQGLLVEAALDYDRASELLRQGAKAPDVQKLLLPASAELKRRIPRVVVEIPSDAPSPLATLDGKAYAPSELALGQALNPGAHQLKVSASGRRPFERAFALKEGDQISIRVELLGAASPTPPMSAVQAGASVPAVAPAVAGTAAPTRGPKSSPKVYLLLGESALTVAGLALGIGYRVAESSAGDRVAAAQRAIDAADLGSGACSTAGSPVSGRCADLRVAIDAHDHDATASTVGFVGAGIGLAALVTTWLVYPSSHAESGRLSVSPVVLFGRVGLQGRF